MKPHLSRRDFLKLSSLALPALFEFKMLEGLASAGKAHQNQPPRPNFLIIIFDTLSALHMPVYGYARDTMPNLTRLADKAAIYHSHYAAGNYTIPGTASLFTGVYPWRHRALALASMVVKEYSDLNFFQRMPSEYYTFAYTQNIATMMLLEQMRRQIDRLMKIRELALVDLVGWDRLFERDYFIAEESELMLLDEGKYENSGSLFLSMISRIVNERVDRQMNAKYQREFPYGVPMTPFCKFLIEDSVDWLANHLPKLSRPYLGYFHLFPPHEPYKPRQEFTGLFQDHYTPPEKPEHFFNQDITPEDMNERRRIYDQYLAYCDAEFGRLYNLLDQEGVLENTYLILTADHGQMLERGIHGHWTPVMFESLVRVPLMIWKPGQAQREDFQSVTSCVDLLPTLLSLTGQVIPAGCEGGILPGFDGFVEDPDRSVFVIDAKSNPKRGPLSKSSIAIRKGNYKLTHYVGYEGYDNVSELYNIGSDPDELTNLYTPDHPVGKELLGIIQQKLAEVDRQFGW